MQGRRWLAAGICLLAMVGMTASANAARSVYPADRDAISLRNGPAGWSEDTSSEGLCVPVLLCLPSRSEAFALVIIEALAAGTPVAGYGPTLVEIRDRLGIDIGEPIFDPTPENVAAAIEAARSRRWDRERLRRATLGEFGPPAIARRYAKLIRTVT